jgi:cytochrome c oxidase assembly factor CtaG
MFWSAWSLSPGLPCVLALVAAIYLRGVHKGRRYFRSEHDQQHALCFLAGLLLLFIAAASPLDSYDAVSLAAHMAQHLILMMLAPGLLLLGYPLLPILRGVPKVVVKRVLKPLMIFKPLRSLAGILVTPPLALTIFAINTIAWHVPVCYEAALSYPPLHALEHAMFFWTGILFWWPIVRPVGRNARWPEWVGIPYLMLADLLNTALSAFFVFSDKLLYPSYAVFHLPGFSPRDDQTLAGALMWVPGSIVYLIPVVIIAMRLVSPPPGRYRRATRQVDAPHVPELLARSRKTW